MFKESSLLNCCTIFCGVYSHFSRVRESDKYLPHTWLSCQPTDPPMSKCKIAYRCHTPNICALDRIYRCNLTCVFSLTSFTSSPISFFQLHRWEVACHYHSTNINTFDRIYHYNLSYFSLTSSLYLPINLSIYNSVFLFHRWEVTCRRHSPK